MPRRARLAIPGIPCTSSSVATTAPFVFMPKKTTVSTSNT